MLIVWFGRNSNLLYSELTLSVHESRRVKNAFLAGVVARTLMADLVILRIKAHHSAKLNFYFGIF